MASTHGKSGISVSPVAGFPEFGCPVELQDRQAGLSRRWHGVLRSPFGVERHILLHGIRIEIPFVIPSGSRYQPSKQKPSFTGACGAAIWFPANMPAISRTPLPPRLSNRTV